MPKIESDYSALKTNLPEVSTQSFVDTRGYGVLQSAVSKVGDTANAMLQKEYDLRDTERKLNEARMLAEGKQKWTIDLDNRIASAEETGNYSGLLDSFDKDYSSWAEEIVKGFPDGQTKEKLRVSLIEMQTPFIAKMSSYVASKRADRIKENYAAISNSIIGQIRTASSEPEVDMAVSSGRPILDNVPGKLRSEMEQKIHSSAIEQKGALKAKVGDTNFSDLMAQLDVTDNNYLNSQSRLIQLQEASKTKVKQDANFNMKMYTELAQKGMVDGSVVDYANSVVAKLPDMDELDKQLLMQQAQSIQVMNDTVVSLYEDGPAKTVDEISSLTEQMDNIPDEDPSSVAKKVALQERRDNMIQALAAQRKAIADDFTGVAREKNSAVDITYNALQYAEDAYKQDPSPAKEMQRKATFEGYAIALESFADQNGVSPKYLSSQELDHIAGLLDDSLSKENGVKGAVGVMADMKSKYGSRYSKVLSQLVTKNDKYIALGAAVDDVDLQFDIIQALSNRNQNPDLFKVENESDTLLTLGLQNTIKTMRAQGLNAQASAIAEAGLLLYGDKLSKGESVKNIGERLTKDFDIQNGVVLPNIGIDLPTMVAGMVNYISKNKSEYKPLFGKDSIGTPIKVDIDRLVSDGLEYRNHPDGQSLMLIWPNTRQPVLDKKGNVARFKFSDYDKYKATIVLPKPLNNSQ